MRTAIGLAAAAVIGLSAPAAAEDILVSAQDLRCVVDNIGVYQGAPTDPVLVIFGRCPDASLDAAAIAALAVNQRIASGGGAAGPAPALSLRKAELDCLAQAGVSDKLFASASGGVIRWPSNVCKF